MSQKSELDFSSILATSAHDMKNSLFMLLQSIEQLDLADNLTPQQHQSVADLHYQTSRINGSLMQLLSLYRDEQNQLPIYIEENSVAEMLHEVIDRNRLFLNSHHVKVDIEVDEELTAFFDQDLVTYLVADIFVNALRHTKSCVTLRAFTDHQYVNIQVEDDGEGYPDHMLAINNQSDSEFNACKGRSGLGLLFAQKIASAHKTNQLQGHILLENKNKAGGSLFTLRLP
jgi:signal transduction histidine kinase